MKTLFTTALILTVANLMAQQKQRIIVHFDFNKYTISKATASQLDSFALTENSRVAYLGIYGHCDSVGNNDYNDELSYKRVIAVKKYLTNKDFSSNNIKEQIGFGKRSPLHSNSNEYGRALNRRVEIVINDDRNSDENNNLLIESSVKKNEPTITQKIEDTIATKTGSNIVLNNLNFYGGRSLILPSSYAVLQELLKAMQKNPSLEIAIEGHICCQPGPGDGLDIDSNTVNLSENRAKAIYTFLVQNDINPERISYKGFGHQYPLKTFPETTEMERSNNRRVEIKIVKR